MRNIILYYIHDPMCSWCWGFRPVWDELQAKLPKGLQVINLTGGLAKDCSEPMADDMKVAIQGWWRDIESQLGTEFNFDFWALNVPRRSTFMSCRATIAAGHQDAQEQMIDAIQRAYYLRAMNPSDVTVLVQLAKELKLDVERFERDLLSEDLEKEFSRQLDLARQLPIDGFPSLVLDVGGVAQPITRDYHDHKVMLDQIKKAISC